MGMEKFPQEMTINIAGEGWGMLAGGNAVVFTDNHDNQRGHGAGGDMILTFRDSRLYKVNLYSHLLRGLSKANANFKSVVLSS